MRYFTFLLLVFSICKLQAQLEFAPVGTKWTYEAAYGDWFGNVYYSLFIIESEKDTLIQNKVFKKLACYTIYEDSSNNRIKNDHYSQFIIQDKHKIYHKIKDSIYQIFDFNPAIGINEYYLGWNIFTNQLNRSQIEYKIINKFPDSSYTFLPNKIEAEITCSVGLGYKIYFYEKFGYLSDIHFYSDSYCITDQGMPFTLRCYEDPSVGLIKFDSIDCDSIKPDIIRTGLIESNKIASYTFSIKILNNILLLTSLNDEIPINEIQIYSINGSQIQTKSFNTDKSNQQVDISELSYGIYILKIKSGEESHSLKFYKL